MVEIISGKLVSALETVVDVSDRGVLFNATPIWVSALVELDVLIEVESALFPVVLGTTDSNDMWGAELVACMLITASCEFLVPFRVATVEGMLLL